MSILVICDCGQSFQHAEDHDDGRTLTCPACGRWVELPGASTTPRMGRSSLPGDDEFDSWAVDSQKTSRNAMASLFLGLVSLACSPTVILGLIFGIPAIGYGQLALREIRTSRGRIKGEGPAIAGIVAGSFSCAFVPALIVSSWFFLNVNVSHHEQRPRSQYADCLAHLQRTLHNY